MGIEMNLDDDGLGMEMKSMGISGKWFNLSHAALVTQQWQYVRNIHELLLNATDGKQHPMELKKR